MTRSKSRVRRWEWSDTVDLRIATFAAVGRYPRIPSQLAERIRDQLGLAELCYRRLQRAFRWLADRGYIVRLPTGWVRARRSEDRAADLPAEAARSHPRSKPRGRLRQFDAFFEDALFGDVLGPGGPGTSAGSP